MIGIDVFAVMVSVVACLTVGIGFMVGRGRAAVAEEQARHWRQAAERMQSERDAAGEQARQERDSGVAEARRERDVEVTRARSERDAALAQIQSERADAEEQRAALQEQLQEAATRSTAAETELAALQQRHTEELAELQERHVGELARAHSMHTEMEAANVRLTTAALNSAGEKLVKQFTDMAEQRAQATSREFDKRENSFDELVKPAVELIKATSGQMTEQITELIKQSSVAQAEFRAQVKQVSTDRDLVVKSTDEVLREVGQLRNVFRKPEARGQWGEQTLQAVVEASGMVNLIDFDDQPTFDTDDRTQRPDLVVKINADMAVVVDAKAPFNALIQASEASDEAAMQERLAAHARHVRTHIDQLSAKQYWRLPTRSPEFVVMFVPSDTFLYAAWEHDRSLWDYAARKNVILATPTSLLAILQSAAAVLRYDKRVTNVQATVDGCAELVKRLAKLADHVRTLGGHLGKSMQSFNSVVGCMNDRVLPQGRRVNELQGGETSLRELDAVNVDLRQVASSFAELDGDSPTAA
ncbi:DNA recombination protein RmuC [Nocardia sp. NPDC019395]|uniref:DNA recombination protein RmuC n=1 Tax=Nocardia sp. NPDC019395 TaxID=3154686 RepID=UPI0033C1111D